MVAKIFAFTGLAALASAHMKMTKPVPYGQSTLNNFPLNRAVPDFPCKQRTGVYDLQGAQNKFEQGSKQTLEFVGTAVHGGGSCQVSVTTDLNPTKNSVWKVIKSIEGGCPAKGTIGNLADSGGAGAKDPFTYEYTIPKELAVGNYTLAWTWFNKVGNREMYMNCAPLTVTGSGGSQSFMNGLPDMFVANAGVNGCGTVDGKDVQFANPGKDVDRFNGATNSFAPATGACAAPTGGGGGGSGGSDGGSSPTSAVGGGGSGSAPSAAPAASQPEASQPAASQPAASQPAASQPAQSQGNSVPGGVFITVSKPNGNDAAPTSAPGVAAPTDSQPGNGDGGSGNGNPVHTSAAGNPAPTSGTGSGGNNSTGGFAPGTACSAEGAWNCVGGTSFQRCASGTWSAVQGMAAGTKCTPGQSDSLNAQAAKVKRGLRHGLRRAV